jgi:hypothetical protein
VDSTFPDCHQPANQLKNIKFSGLVSESLFLAKVNIWFKTLRIRLPSILMRSKQQAGKLLERVDAQSLSIQPYLPKRHGLNQFPQG